MRAGVYTCKLRLGCPQALEEGETATALDVSNTLWALGRLGSRPSEDDARKLLQLLVSRLDSCNDTSLAQSLWSLATLRLLHIEGAQVRRRCKPPAMSTDPSPSLSLSRARTQALYESIAVLLETMDHLRQDNTPRLLYHAYLMARHEGVALPFPAAFLGAASATWTFKLHNSGPNALHERVDRALAAFEVSHKLHDAAADGVLRVHVAVPREGARPVALMLSGYSDYVHPCAGAQTERVETGPVAMETAMLTADGWDVVRVGRVG